MKLSFALILLCASLTGLCGTPVATMDTTHQITIMTYNIKMLPRGGVAFLHHFPLKRAKLIPDKVIAEGPDVVVFQECFDGMAVRILRKKLKAAYPYNMGYKNRRVFTYNKAGGVLMFSKYPMKEVESIKYSQCKGIDCAGNKGCLLVEVEHPVRRFQLLGTHMQAGGSDSLKMSQYTEAGALLKRHEQPGMPQFAAGDFNTRKTSANLYPQLIKDLDAQDGDISGDMLFTSDHLLNDMESYNPKHRNLIDYVFFRPNGVSAIFSKRYIRKFEQQWDKKHKDLSDHFAMILKMQL